MFYIVDSYAYTVEDEATTRDEASKKLRALGDETGIFIWQIIEAKDRTELTDILTNLEKSNDEAEESDYASTFDE